jgi:uncharacterized Zn finger protein
LRPYRVRIGIGAFDKSEWAQVEGAVAENAWYAAALLSGEMPDDIEDVFAGLGLTLFPATARELSLDCSCPDGAVPCKHLAATFYLLAESFDDDPFAILAWRGRERGDLLANVQAARSKGRRPAADRTEPTGRPLTDCLDSYFIRQAEITSPSPRVPSSTAARSASRCHRRGAWSVVGRDSSPCVCRAGRRRPVIDSFDRRPPPRRHPPAPGLMTQLHRGG